MKGVIIEMSKDEDRYKRDNENIEDINIEIREIDDNNRNDTGNERFNKKRCKEESKIMRKK